MKRTAIMVVRREVLLAALFIVLGTVAPASAQVQQPQPFQSYRYAGGPVTVFAANPTDWIVLTGSTGAKTIAITSISICGTASIPATLDVSLVARSTADSGGTSTQATAVTLNDAGGASTSKVAVYTVNPVLGTSLGALDVQKLNVNPPGAAGCIYLDGGTRTASAPLLRGTTSQFAINLGGVAVPTGLSLDWRIELTEGTGQ